MNCFQNQETRNVETTYLSMFRQFETWMESPVSMCSILFSTKYYETAVEEGGNNSKREDIHLDWQKNTLQTQWYYSFKYLDWKGEWKTGKIASLTGNTTFKSDLGLAVQSLPECIHILSFQSRIFSPHYLPKDQVLTTM